MIGRILLVAFVLCGLVAQVDAGPFGRFGRNSCSSGNCSSDYSNQVAGGGCSSGQCAAPVQVNGELKQEVAFIAEVVPNVASDQSSVNWAMSQKRTATHRGQLSRSERLIQSFRNR